MTTSTGRSKMSEPERQSLVSAAAEAVEVFGEDALERHAAKLRAAHFDLAEAEARTVAWMAEACPETTNGQHFFVRDPSDGSNHCCRCGMPRPE